MAGVRTQQLLLATAFLVLAGSLWVIAATAFGSKDVADDLPIAARGFDEAQFRRDREALEHFLEADMTYVRGSGVVAGKREFIAGFTDPETAFSSLKIRNRKMIPIGREAAIVSADATIRGRSAGKPFEEHIHYSDVFVRRGGELRVIHVQVTPLGKH